MSKQGEIEYPQKLPNHDWLYLKPFCESPLVTGKELIRFGWLVRIMNAKPDSRILDIGIGSGWTSIFLAKMGHHLTGIDISPDMIKIAQERAHKENLDIDFLTADIERGLPKEWSSYYDYVLFYDSLHHMHGEDSIFEHCYRVLKPGGALVLSEPNLLHGFSNNSKKLIELYDVTERGFTWWTLRTKLKNAGFSTIRRYNNPFRRPLQMIKPLDILEGFFFGFLEFLFLSHWKTTILMTARKRS